MQDGTSSSSFLMFLNELEHEGVITLQHGDVPPRLKGACRSLFWGMSCQSGGQASCGRVSHCVLP